MTRICIVGSHKLSMRHSTCIAIARCSEKRTIRNDKDFVNDNCGFFVRRRTLQHGVVRWNVDWLARDSFQHGDGRRRGLLCFSKNDENETFEVDNAAKSDANCSREDDANSSGPITVLKRVFALHEEYLEDLEDELCPSKGEDSTKDTEAFVERKVTWQSVMLITTKCVSRNLWSLILVHLLCDAAVFLLHRLSHRLTNEVALKILRSPEISATTIGNLWWLSGNPQIANFETGYQFLTIGFFLLAFPLNVLLKSIASIATILICDRNSGNGITKTKNPFTGLLGAFPVVKSSWNDIMSTWRSVFVVELLVSAIVVPLQFASLAVVTLPFTLPRILNLQAATPVAIFEHKNGIDALKRSKDLIENIRKSIAAPFVLFIAGQRLLETGRGWMLSLVPERFYAELVEIPIVIIITTTAVAVFLARMQDILPWIAFRLAKKVEENKKQHAQ